MREIPVHSRPRKLVDWINATGAEQDHSFIDQGHGAARRPGLGRSFKTAHPVSAFTNAFLVPTMNFLAKIFAV